MRPKSQPVARMRGGERVGRLVDLVEVTINGGIQRIVRLRVPAVIKMTWLSRRQCSTIVGSAFGRFELGRHHQPTPAHVRATCVELLESRAACR